MFSKILIANRGEIAMRIVRAAQELGVATVAVHSEADRFAPHVLAADEAYPIGPAAAAESYLVGDRLIDVALQSGAEAIHPGYGFLAERASFIREVHAAGLAFIGPSAEAVAAMGDKRAARQQMQGAGIPIVPGSNGVENSEEAAREASAIGYPVLLKAAAGGGGKGMRIVRSEAEIEGAFLAAGNEARAAFGDGSIYLERFLDRPRHIEIQVLADGAGRTLHLGERECSIQRRHQKMIEEAPSPVLSAKEREQMGATAIAAARAVGYEGAGTVEFLYHEGRFYFLEMNTRIQVEHPVTEMITGIDVVQWQIRIAAGEALPFEQGDIAFRGHAIECRITSEDPYNSFLPSTGRIEELTLPTGPGVRWDAGIAQGSEVGLSYDPLLAKLIVHASTRTEAIERMRRALLETRIVGIETSIPFHLRVMGEEEFRSGSIDIGYLERHADSLLGGDPDVGELRIAALAIALAEQRRRDRSLPPRIQSTRPASGWSGRRGWGNR